MNPESNMDSLLSPRRRSLLQAMGAASLLAACGERPRAAPLAAEFHGPTMGSTYTVKIAGPRLAETVREATGNAARAALADVQRMMTAFAPDSELSAFNAHAASRAFALSEDSFAVLERALEVSAASGGAFDVTVAPLVDAWGFGPTRTRRWSSPAERAAVETPVGWRMLSLDSGARSATKQRPDLRIDLSGIAKGYGVDRAALALEALGVQDYLVEAGGEVRTRGHNSAGEPWQVAIERPDPRVRAPYFVVPVSGLSMATSGDYRIFYEQDGVRYSHEIDPHSGAPVRHTLTSVTVLASDCTSADAWSTALFVLGPEAGYALAEARGIAAYFIRRGEGERLIDRATSSFAALGGRRVAA